MAERRNSAHPAQQQSARRNSPASSNVSQKASRPERPAGNAAGKPNTGNNATPKASVPGNHSANRGSGSSPEGSSLGFVFLAFVAVAFIIYMFMSCTGQITQEAKGTVPLDSVSASEHYYRSYLDAKDQSAYDAIEIGVRSFDSTIQLDEAYPLDDLNQLVLYVLYDSPDLVWFEGTYDYSTNQDGKVSKLSPVYTMGRSQAEHTLRSYLAMSSEVPTVDDPIEQMLLIMDFIADNTSHDESGVNDQTVSSLITSHYAVCAGYAKTTVLMARDHGIPAIYISGTNSSERHAWLAAKVGGEVLYYDPFGYDGDGVKDNRESAERLSDFSVFHKADEPSKLPAR